MNRPASTSGIDHSDVPIGSFPASTDTPTLEPKRTQLTHGKMRARNLSAVEVVQRLEKGDVIYLRKSIWDLFPELFGLAAIIVFFAVFALANPETIFGVVMGGLIACAVVGMIIFRKLNEKRHELAWNMVSSTVGRHTNQQRSLTIDSTQLKTTEVTQTILQRIFNVGDVRVSDMVPDSTDIIFEGIPCPDFYAAVMRELYRRRTVNAT